MKILREKEVSQFLQRAKDMQPFTFATAPKTRLPASNTGTTGTTGTAHDRKRKKRSSGYEDIKGSERKRRKAKTGDIDNGQEDDIAVIPSQGSRSEGQGREASQVRPEASEAAALKVCNSFGKSVSVTDFLNRSVMHARHASPNACGP